MQAREIMTEEPACCVSSDSLRKAAQMMRDENCGLLPIVDNLQNKRLIGVLTDRDIVCRALASESTDCNRATAGDVMTSGDLWTVKPDDSVDDVIEKMEEGQVRRIPVVDDAGKVQGIISTADIALEIDEPEEIAEVIEEISEPTHSPHA